ncbi:MAG: hypothetical protein KF781_00120 [Chitinophagaceae bacterium]|nr:hypothetical protein [Chitinophagaceae bacterium]MCW5905138.1 hypothetical protein [Chitinophagaceae bacterium]
MLETKEINALFTLIDDPDEEVYHTVSNRIIGLGKDIIPNLEDLWENTLNETAQGRIEMLIHNLQFSDLVVSFKDWRDSAYNDLLAGALLVAKYQYPDLHTTPVLQEIEKIRRNVWLELNNFLTPLEQANVLSSIIFNYYNISGGEVNYTYPDEFFIHKILESKKGNAVSNGIMYQIICEQLDINARIINIPKQMIIAFYHRDYNPEDSDTMPQENILFYVDGVNGRAYGQLDIENYFKRMAVPPIPAYYKPISHKRIIQILLEETSKCFNTNENFYKQEELINLANLLNE